MEELYTFTIPENFMQVSRFFGFRIRNIIEAVISALVVGGIVSFIPFVLKVRIICQVVLGASVGLRFLIGQGERSMSEFIIDYVRYRQRAKRLHLRTVQHEPTGAVAVDESGKRLSYAEMAAKKVIDAGKKVAK